MPAVAFVDCHPILEADERGQPFASRDKGRRDIDAGHSAVKSKGEVTRRAAETAANVEKPMVRLDRQLIGKFDSGRKAARMEMINGRQILYREAVHRFARL